MSLILLIASVGLLAQFDPDAPGMEPYVFFKRGEDDVRLYALVKPEDLEETRKVIINVILDEPWLPLSERHQTLRRSEYRDPYSPKPSTRARHIREGWLAYGGVEVDTPEGRVWIHGEEYELALRAERMAAEARGGDMADPVPRGASAAGASEEGLGFWSEWGVHIILVAGAVALSALVVWFTMLRGSWTPLRS